MTRHGTMHKQGDILLIPIPFTDLTSSKKRPVLVVSNDYYNKATEEINNLIDRNEPGTSSGEN